MLQRLARPQIHYYLPIARPSRSIRPCNEFSKHQCHLHSLSNRSICWDKHRHAHLPRHPKCARSLTTSAIPPLLLPPVIFVGLLLGLWTWKCFWIVVMQNKLLYLSWLPPFSRSDQISEYEAECKPAQWQEHRIQSLDGTSLAICQGHIPRAGGDKVLSETRRKRKSVVICYFQGNGGSTPLRLPLLSQVLKTIATQTKSDSRTSYTVVALSYRGYWKSSGRATQSGIERDAQAFLNWVSESYSTPDTDLEIILWGHSLGAVVASSALSTYLTRREQDAALSPISGLIMEAPMSNVKDMLVSLYPQRWLPYRYLWPFSWNTWCSDTALKRLASWKYETMDDNDAMLHQPPAPGGRLVPPILILSAENDEVIPAYVADDLERRCREFELDVTRKRITGAMHPEIPVKADGKDALAKFILRDNPATS